MFAACTDSGKCDRFQDAGRRRRRTGTAPVPQGNGGRHSRVRKVWPAGPAPCPAAPPHRHGSDRRSLIAESPARLYSARMRPQAAFPGSDRPARLLRAVLGVLLLLVLCCAPGGARLSPSESPIFAAKAAQYVALPGELRFARPAKPAQPEPPVPPSGLPFAAAPRAPAAPWAPADWRGDALGELPAAHPVRPASQAPPLTA